MVAIDLSSLLETFGLTNVVSTIVVLIAFFLFVGTIIAVVAAFAKSGGGGAQQAKKRLGTGLLATVLVLMVVPLIDWGWGLIETNKDKIKDAPTQILENGAPADADLMDAPIVV